MMRADPNSAPGDTDGQPWLFLFDGDCGLCERTAEWLTARMRPEPFVAVAWQTLPELPCGVEKSRLEREALLIRGARLDGGFDAFALLASRITILWPLALARHIPLLPWLGRAVYRFIARRRRLLSGSLGLRACALPVVDFGAPRGTTARSRATLNADGVAPGGARLP